MSKGEIINGYVMINEFTNVGAGNSRWGYATDKNGEVKFIKEFLNPVYPLPGSGLSPKQLASKAAICEKFCREKTELYSRLKSCDTGNIITIDDFFKFNTRYYICTEAVRTAFELLPFIHKADDDKKRVLFKALSYSMARLHRNGIIHCDLKPSNLLIKATEEGYFTAKIIDFDSGIIADKQDPEDNEIDFDPVYMSPEMLRRTFGEKIALTDRSDIFALGIIMHEYWAGTLPRFSRDYGNVAEAILKEKAVTADENLPADIRETINEMLLPEPSERPDAQSVFERLKRADGEKLPEKAADMPPEPPKSEPPKPELSKPEPESDGGYWKTPKAL